MFHYIKLTNYLQDKVQSEEGEVASWLILAAGLAIAAGLASTELKRIIAALASEVASAAGV